MQHWIDADPGRKAADAARKEGISRPRVSQLLSLLQLSPSIQEDIDDTSQTGPVPGERELWDIARLPSSEQVCRYQELTGKRLTDIAIARKTLRHTGFQHLFVRARRLKAMLDSGDYRSMAEIGLVEGISGARVAQLLNLLELSPELQTQLDVPAERAPRIQEEQLRKVARLRSHEAQKAEFLLFLKEG